MRQRTPMVVLTICSFLWITPTVGAEAAATPAPATADAYKSVTVDLQSNALLSPLPADRPFVLTGKAPLTVTLVEVRYETTGNCPVQGVTSEATWFRMLPPADKALTIPFRVPAPALSAQAKHTISLDVYRELETGEASAMTTEILDVGAVPAEQLEQHLNNAGELVSRRGYPPPRHGPWMPTSVPGQVTASRDALGKAIAIGPANVPYATYAGLSPPGGGYLADFANPHGAEAIKLLDELIAAGGQPWAAAARLSERMSSLKAVRAILKDPKVARSKSRGEADKTLDALFKAGELKKVAASYGSTGAALMAWCNVLTYLTLAPAWPAGLTAAPSMSTILVSTNTAIAKTLALEKATTERLGMAKKRDKAIAEWLNLVRVRTRHEITVDTYRNWTVGADLGFLSAFGTGAPYGGLNIGLWPLNKDTAISKHSGGLRSRLSFTLGLTATSIENEKRGRYGIVEKRAGVVAVNLRLTQSVKFGIGALIFRQTPPDNPLAGRKESANAHFYSVSIDQDLSKLAEGLAAGLSKLIPGT